MAFAWDIIKAKFITSAVRAEQYPTIDLSEVAFVGRSNVGKSSLINSLCRQNKLAKTSGSPGKTQTINFYELQAKAVFNGEDVRRGFYLVDLPGYGFAKASRDAKTQWSGFIRTYLTSSDRLKLVCQLIDIRHPLMESDLVCFHWLISSGLPVQVVLTKSDKLSKQSVVAQHAALSKALGLDKASVIAYSSMQNTGRAELIDKLSKAFV